jgi:molecular chaperone GrpE
MALADDKPEGKGFTVNDRRDWLREDYDPEAPETAGNTDKPSYVEELETQLEERGRRLLEAQDAIRAARDEVDQVRIRLERDLDRRLDVERARLAEPFVEVLDNLQRMVLACQEGDSSQPLTEGAALVVKQLDERLRGLGLVPIEAAGQRFDPNSMEAMATQPVPADRVDEVVQVIRPGYRLGDRVVRPAGVLVGVAERN